jgi:beta-lactamase class D
VTQVRKQFAVLAALFVIALNIPTTRAGTACTIIVDANSGEVLVQQGACGTRASPASTFKMALSLMGFDAGVLVDAHTPALPYKDEYKAAMESWRVTTDPTIWVEDSIVWYSQVLTKTLGAERFQKYVDSLNYGNRDLSGDAGRNNGLTNAWLSSSLQISPAEQVAFIRQMLAGRLPVSRKALETTMAIMPSFPAADDWMVHGKTGSGLQRGADGKLNRDLQFGWFVGWATANKRNVVFATLVNDSEKIDDRAGIRVRSELIEALPGLVAGRQ